MTDLLIESTALEDRLRAVLPSDVDYASARLVDERSEHLSVRRNQLEPMHTEFDTGVMITIWNDGGLGYAATTDLSDDGLAAAVDRARYWADCHRRLDGRHGGTDRSCRRHLRLAGRGHVGHAAVERPSRTAPAAVAPARDRRPHRRLERVAGTPRRRPVAAHRRAQRRHRTRRAALPLRLPEASGPRRTKARTPRPERSARNAFCGQGGAEVLGRYGFGDAASQIAEQALELLTRAQLSHRRDGRIARPRSDDPADPRVDRPPARTRPDPRRRTQLCGHQLRHPRDVRYVPVRLRAAQRHVRPDCARAARVVRLRRRRHAGRTPASHRERHPGPRPRRGCVAGAQRARRAWPTRGRRIGTDRRSTGWRTSTSSPATRPSTS